METKVISDREIKNLVTYERIADQKRLNFIANAVASRAGKHGKVLDVGCGNGVISIQLGRLGFNVTGIDVSEKTIQTASSNNPFEHVSFKVLSAEELVATGELFDVIICSEVLEHLSHPEQLLKTLYLSLKPNGILIVTVPNGYGPRETLVTKPYLKMRNNHGFVWRIVTTLKSWMGYRGTTVQSAADNLDHIQFFSRSDLHQLAAANKFKITKLGKANFIEDVFPFSFFTRRIKFLQKMDCKIADVLPFACTGGFFSIWEKEEALGK